MFAVEAVLVLSARAEAEQVVEEFQAVVAVVVPVEKLEGVQIEEPFLYETEDL